MGSGILHTCSAFDGELWEKLERDLVYSDPKIAMTITQVLPTP